MHVIFKAFVLFLALGAGLYGPAAHAESLDPTRPLWMRSPAISPDGTSIAFTYRGRVYTVDRAGGEAKPLTDPEFRATDPVWSPDGKAIAFSAAVFNVGDVYLAPLDGGEIRRLTADELMEVPLAFTPDGRDLVYFSAGIGAMEANFLDALTLFPQGKTLSVPAAGGRERAFMPIPAQKASISPDGNLVAYAFSRSEEVPQRKRQISDGTSDIWIFDRRTGKHRQLTHHRSNEKSPVFSADGAFVYFTAEMPLDGETNVDAKPVSTNVWRMATDGKSPPEQISFHDTLPVRGLSVSRDGVLSYGYDGEIWTLAPGSEPTKVAIRIAQGTLAAGATPLKVNDQVTELTVSPDGSEIALVARGDVYVVDAKSGKTRGITATAQAERSVGFSPDGRKLLYASDRQVDWDLFESRIVAQIDRNGSAELVRLTVLKTWFDKPGRLIAFALWIAQQATTGKPPASATEAALLAHARELLAEISARGDLNPPAMRDLHGRLQDFQSDYRSRNWGHVRLVHSHALMLIEDALAICLLHPGDPRLGYKLAADYCGHYDSTYGRTLNGPSRERVQAIVGFIAQREADEAGVSPGPSVLGEL